MQTFIGSVQPKLAHTVFWVIFTEINYPYSSLEVNIAETLYLKAIKAEKNHGSVLERKKKHSQLFLFFFFTN